MTNKSDLETLKEWIEEQMQEVDEVNKLHAELSGNYSVHLGVASRTYQKVLREIHKMLKGDEK